jgi:Asp-tRNA(Asn)/Glu-tRNA(Gln) amidotransferase A subunit family amidase
MNELLSLTLIELAETLLNKKASPVDLMEAVLDRIDATNGDLNAVVAMRDRDALMADAKTAEDRIARGEGRPLEGIPLGVKDLEDVEGMVTSMGSLVFADDVAQQDSDQVARFREAGAIVLGKTNTPEFGYTAITKNLVYGVTRSPWNLERSPGGSSGGSSAAIASCMLPLATGSDGGGSVRLPASFTGAFGLKPSYGRISTGPRKRWNYHDTAGHGPITKTVEDAALFMDQVAGPSPNDPNSLPHPGYSYLEKVREPIANTLRIGFSPDLGYAVVQSDIATAVEEGAKLFEQHGHTLEAVTTGPPLLAAEWGRLGAFEVGSGIAEYLPEHESQFGRSFLAGIKNSESLTAAWWGEAAKKRAQLNDWCADIFSKYDVLITPTVPFDPPPAGGPFPLETEGRKQVDVGVAAFTVPFNLSWHPAATVRAGISEAGLPIGLQIVGPRHREDLVLQVARLFERERPWHPEWPTQW